MLTRSRRNDVAAARRAAVRVMAGRGIARAVIASTMGLAGRGTIDAMMRKSSAGLEEAVEELVVRATMELSAYKRAASTRKPSPPWRDCHDRIAGFGNWTDQLEP